MHADISDPDISDPDISDPDISSMQILYSTVLDRLVPVAVLYIRPTIPSYIVGSYILLVPLVPPPGFFAACCAG